MKHITRWSPDTCDCIIEYEWDDSVPAEERVHTPTTIVKACSAHVIVGGPTNAAHGVFSQVHEENTRKNKALNEVLEALPDSEKIKESDVEGNQISKFKIEPKWRFDENRHVEIELPGEIGKNKIFTKSLHNRLVKKLGNKVRMK